MLKFISSYFTILIILLITTDCVFSRDKMDKEIQDFLELLVREQEPTYAEYEKISGVDTDEYELAFQIRECNLRGWEGLSKLCVDFTRNIARSPDKNISLSLNWLRKQFSTIGNKYHIISIVSKTEGWNHDLVEAKIGKNNFLLYHNTGSNKPTSVIVRVSKVNGRNINDYFADQLW